MSREKFTLAGTEDWVLVEYHADPGAIRPGAGSAWHPRGTSPDVPHPMARASPGPPGSIHGPHGPGDRHARHLRALRSYGVEW